MSLRWRLVLVFGVLGALAIGAATLIAWLSTSNELRGEVDTFLLRRGEEITDGRRQLPQGPGDFGGGPPGAPATFAPDVVTQVLTSEGEVVQTVGADLPVDEGDVAVATGADRSRLRTVTVDGVELRVLTTHLESGGAVQIARELTAVYQPGCNTERYDPAWKDEWIGDYTAPTAGPLTTARNPDPRSGA